MTPSVTNEARLYGAAGLSRAKQQLGAKVEQVSGRTPLGKCVLQNRYVAVKVCCSSGKKLLWYVRKCLYMHHVCLFQYLKLTLVGVVKKGVCRSTFQQKF